MNGNAKHWLSAACILFATLFAAGCASPNNEASELAKRIVKTSKSADGAKDSGRRSSLKVSAPNIRDVKDVSAYRMNPGDQIVIYLRSIPDEKQIEDVIDENGNITLDFIDIVHAAGRTPSELEQAIQRAYLDQKIYKRITVNVVIPTQSYFVQGEVRQPGRYPLISGVSIVRAIAAAGGYTEFANPKKTTLIRAGKTRMVNVIEMEENPEKDEPLEAGDVLKVPRGWI